jgi:peptidoglycan/xylan/chitin deacetylase (PgdA/CDA1 family)
MSRAAVPVLMYHGLGVPGPRAEAHYTFSEESFARQLRQIQEQGRVVSLETLLEGRAGPGDVVLTFDDGEDSVTRVALPMMRELGMVGTLFVTTAWIGTEGFVGEDDLRALRDAGWSMGTHGVTHRYLSDLSDMQVREELVQSRDTMTRILGEPPVHMSLPGGRRESRRVVKAVRAAGYGSLCTSTVGVNESPPNPFGVRRTMMIQPFDDPRTLERILAPDPLFYLKLRTRQEVLEVAKLAMGNPRYERLRGLAFGAMRRLRRS